MTLGEYIKSFRISNNDMSQRAFAVRCGLSNGYISMLEKGFNPKTGEPIKPTLTKLKQLANGMNMTVMALMSVVDETDIDISCPDNITSLHTTDHGEEYLLAARSKDGKQAVRQLTKQQYEIAKRVVESLDLNEDENL